MAGFVGVGFSRCCEYVGICRDVVSRIGENAGFCGGGGGRAHRRGAACYLEWQIQKIQVDLNFPRTHACVAARGPEGKNVKRLLGLVFVCLSFGALAQAADNQLNTMMLERNELVGRINALAAEIRAYKEGPDGADALREFSKAHNAQSAEFLSHCRGGPSSTPQEWFEWCKAQKLLNTENYNKMMAWSARLNYPDRWNDYVVRNKALRGELAERDAKIEEYKKAHPN